MTNSTTHPLVERMRVTEVDRGRDGSAAVFAVERSIRKVSADGRVMGGQLAGQMLLAAAATVRPEKTVAAMHVDFMTLGDVESPLRFEVERTCEARTELRRVVARQGQAIAVGTFTFQPPGEGFEHQHTMPGATPPALLAPHWRYDGHGFQVRTEEAHDPLDPAASDDAFRMWWHVDGAVPDEPGLHQALLAYIGDLSLPAAPFRTVEGIGAHMLDRIVTATINYTIWFHRPFRVDGWLLHDHVTPSAAGGRALSISNWYAGDGALVASCAQQTVARLRAGAA